MLETPFITALRQAAEQDNLSLIKQAVEAGANIDGIFAFDLTPKGCPFKLEVDGSPLQFALMMGSNELFSYLNEKLKKNIMSMTRVLKDML